MLVPLPERLREHALAPGQVVEPRDASTIVLLRDGADAPETYLLRRRSSMAFAAGMFVFPGGGVHEGDTDPIAATGPSWAQWAERLACDEATARGLVVAAVRETFEESGILLAGTDEHTALGDASGPDFVAARAALEAHELTLAAFLAEQGLVLRTDLLGAWSRWITPDFEPRRYDTRFFVAAIPEGQVVGDLPGEADRAHWSAIPDALARAERGEVAMMPPTVITLQQVAPLRPDEVVAASAERSLRPVQPRVVEVDGELFLHNDSDEE